MKDVKKDPRAILAALRAQALGQPGLAPETRAAFEARFSRFEPALLQMIAAALERRRLKTPVVLSARDKRRLRQFTGWSLAEKPGVWIWLYHSMANPQPLVIKNLEHTYVLADEGPPDDPTDYYALRVGVETTEDDDGGWMTLREGDLAEPRAARADVLARYDRAIAWYEKSLAAYERSLVERAAAGVVELVKRPPMSAEPLRLLRAKRAYVAEMPWTERPHPAYFAGTQDRAAAPPPRPEPALPASGQRSTDAAPERVSYRRASVGGAPTIHAVPYGDDASALCGQRPSYKSGGWLSRAAAVTCPACIARLARMPAPPEPPPPPPREPPPPPRRVERPKTIRPPAELPAPLAPGEPLPEGTRARLYDPRPRNATPLTPRDMALLGWTRIDPRPWLLKGAAHWRHTSGLEYRDRPIEHFQRQAERRYKARAAQAPLLAQAGLVPKETAEELRQKKERIAEETAHRTDQQAQDLETKIARYVAELGEHAPPVLARAQRLFRPSQREYVADALHQALRRVRQGLPPLAPEEARRTPEEIKAGEDRIRRVKEAWARVDARHPAVVQLARSGGPRAAQALDELSRLREIEEAKDPVLAAHARQRAAAAAAAAPPPPPPAPPPPQAALPLSGAAFYDQRENAERVAADAGKHNDDGWTYIVEPRGARWVVVVRDEAGNVLGTM